MQGRSPFDSVQQSDHRRLALTHGQMSGLCLFPALVGASEWNLYPPLLSHITYACCIQGHTLVPLCGVIGPGPLLLHLTFSTSNVQNGTSNCSEGTSQAETHLSLFSFACQASCIAAQMLGLSRAIVEQ